MRFFGPAGLFPVGNLPLFFLKANIKRYANKGKFLRLQIIPDLVNHVAGTLAIHRKPLIGRKWKLERLLKTARAVTVRFLKGDKLSHFALIHRFSDLVVNRQCST